MISSACATTTTGARARAGSRVIATVCCSRSPWRLCSTYWAGRQNEEIYLNFHASAHVLCFATKLTVCLVARQAGRRSRSLRWICTAPVWPARSRTRRRRASPCRCCARRTRIPAALAADGAVTTTKCVLQLRRCLAFALALAERGVHLRASQVVSAEQDVAFVMAPNPRTTSGRIQVGGLLRHRISFNPPLTGHITRIQVTLRSKSDCTSAWLRAACSLTALVVIVCECLQRWR